MKTTRLMAFLSLLALALAGVNGAGAAGEVVIANEGVAVLGLSATALETLFTGRTQMLPTGETAVLAVLKDGPAHESFLKRLGTTPRQFTATWRNLTFTGKAKMPVSFATEQELVEFVAKTPGAIGYVSDTTPRPGVKVLKIN